MGYLFILQAVYFMMPAYFANMAPVFFRRLKFLDYPIDFGKHLRGRRLTGDNKTYRGLIGGILLGVITAYLQSVLYTQHPILQQLSITDYSSWLIIGFMLGFGAVLGDIVESIFKRQFGIKPGKPWIPFDQLDFVIGGLAVVSFVYAVPIKIIVTILIVSPILHILVNHFAYYTGIRKEKW